MDSRPEVVTTCDEFERLAPTLGPCELVDGQIVPLELESFEHSYCSSKVVILLGNFALKGKVGRVLTNKIGIHIRHDLPRTRGADVAYISYKRIPRNKAPSGFLRTAPELIVEIFGIEDSWKDLEEKVEDYHRTGVDMVWVADPHTRTVKLFPRDGESKIVHDGELLDGGAILPGFSVPVAEFFDE